MEKELKDFIKDWSINAPNYSATHKDGLKFKCNNRNLNTRSQIEISNIPQWYPKQKESGLSNKMIEKKLTELQQEFEEIYAKVIIPQNNLLQQSNNR